MGFKVKEELFDGIGYSYEVYIYNFRDRGSVYGMRRGIRICVGAWVQ